MNLVQDIVDAVLGSDVLDLATDVDKNLLFLGSLFFMFFVYWFLRSLSRFFTNGIRF